MRYVDVVRAAYKTDPDFVVLCKTLYPELVAKDGPDQADVHVPGNDGKKRKKLPVMDNRGLEQMGKRSSSGIPVHPRTYHRDDSGRFAFGAGVAMHAATAGLAGTASLVAGQRTAKSVKGLAELTGQLRRSERGRKVLIRALAGHSAKTVGLAAIGGVAGAAAGHHGHATYQEIHDRTNLERQHRSDVRHATRDLDLNEYTDEERQDAVVRTQGHRGGAQTTIHRPGAERTVHYSKSDVDMTGEITGINEDKHQVFGWASVIEKNGVPVIDHQGDYIGVDELEKAAYDYVQNSRIGGAMHYRVDSDGNLIEKSAPYHAADLIESFVVTPQKIEKMGLPESTSLGWWVGFKVNDPEVWDLVKSGEWKGFSVHGTGHRTDRSLEDLNIDGAELTRE